MGEAIDHKDAAHQKNAKIRVNTVLTATGALGSVVLVLLLFAVSVINIQGRIAGDLTKQGQVATERLSKSLAKAVWDFDPDSAFLIVKGELGNEDLVRVTILKPDGSNFLDMYKTPAGNVVYKEGSIHKLSEGPAYALEQSALIQFRDVIVAQVQVQLTDQPRMARFSQDLAGYLAAQLIIAFAVIFLILYMTRLLLVKPIEEVTQVVERFALRDFETRAPEFYSREMNRMGEVLNQMAHIINGYQSEMEDLVELRTAQLLESTKFAQIGVFITGLAHEMNTPMGNSLMAVSFINSRLDWLERQIKDNKLSKSELTLFLEESQQAGRMAYQGIERTTRFMQTLKTIGANNTVQGEQVVDMDAFMMELVSGLKAEASLQSVSLHYSSTPGLMLFFHEGVLYLVLSNLVFLSLGYAFSGRSDGNIHLWVKHDGTVLQIEMADNGTGLDEDKLAKLFSPFGLSSSSLNQAAHQSFSRQSLGPYILKSLLQSIQGDLEGSSSPEKGSRFVITMPARAVEAPSGSV